MATAHVIGPPDGWARRAEQQDGRTGFGEWLRRAREARGLTLDDLTRETKIPLRNLEALEHGNLGEMPTFYQRAEVRAVAKAVGVDERLAVDRLVSAITPVVASEAKVSRPSAEIDASVVLMAFALGAFMLAAAVTGARTADADSVAPHRRDQGRREPVAVSDLSRGRSRSRSLAVSHKPYQLPCRGAGESWHRPASVTELVVRTEPSGAQVTVNGIGWGVSPVTIRHLPPGEKHIRATKEGFAATERVLALDAGQRQALDLRLATAP